MAVVEKPARIVNRNGLHARPAAAFVKAAAKFSSDILVTKEGLEVNGKSIMGVLMLGAAWGSTLVIRAEGDDAEAAIEALTELVASGFSE